MAEAMDKASLQAAQSCLRITDVALRESRCWLADGFEPKYEHPEVDVQFLQRTARSEVMEVEDGDHGKHELLRVFVALGIRWVRCPPKPRGRKHAKSTHAEPEVLALVEATFMAEYEMVKKIETPALDQFAIYNVPWNVWPYWREYVTNQSNRMNLPKVTMPLQGLHPTKAAAAEIPKPD